MMKSSKPEFKRQESWRYKRDAERGDRVPPEGKSGIRIHHICERPPSQRAGRTPRLARVRTREARCEDTHHQDRRAGWREKADRDHRQGERAEFSYRKPWKGRESTSS